MLNIELVTTRDNDFDGYVHSWSTGHPLVSFGGTENILCVFSDVYTHAIHGYLRWCTTFFMDDPADLPFCEPVGNHACVSLPATEIVNATALRLCSMHKYDLFDRTHRRMFGQKQAKLDALDCDCGYSSAQIN